MAKTLHYPFKDAPSLTDVASGVELAITRATTAMMKDADGWLREVQSGEARFPGAAFSHNLALQSEDLSTGWTTNRGSISTDQIANPVDGLVTADKFVEDTATGTHGPYQSSSVYIANHTYLFSCYVRAAERTEVQFQFAGTASPNSVNMFVDLTDGSIGTVGGNTEDYGVIDAGGGWYRLWMVATADSTASGYPLFATSTGSETTSYTGDGSSGMYFWGLQVEDVSGAWDSENLLLQSNQFDTTWTNVASTETSGKSDPDGGTDAWSINEDATAASGHAISQNVNLTSYGPGRYYTSVKAKASNRDWLAIQIGGMSGGGVSYFDLANGVVGATNNNDGYGITDLGNGWYLCWVYTDIGSPDQNGFVRLYAAEGDNDVNYDGLSQESILVYQAQMQRSKPSQTASGTYTETTTAAVTNYSPSTYIPTTTAAVSSLSGANDGLLVEESRTNICLQSEDFGTTWSASAFGVINTNQTIAPDGSLTADQLIDDAGTGTGAVTVSQSVTLSATTDYCFSVFVKADQLSWVALQPNAFTGIDDAVIYFDLASGAVGTAGADIDSSGIEDYGNGWYRCWFVFGTEADGSGNMRIYLSDGDGDITIDRDGTSSIFVWGAQLEAGAFPTSYIPTTTGSVTRNADDVTSTDVSWFNDGGPGTFYAHEVTDHINTPNEQTTYSVADGGVTRWRNYAYTANGAARVATSALVGDSGFNSLNGVYVAGTAVRSVSAVDTNDLASYWNGSPDASPDTTVALPDGVDELLVGSASGGSLYFNGLIKEIAYFDERLDNATLQAISTDGSAAFPSAGYPYVMDLVGDLTYDLVQDVVN